MATWTEKSTENISLIFLRLLVQEMFVLRTPYPLLRVGQWVSRKDRPLPVDFLSDEQAQGYAQFRDDLTATELAQFFYLDASDQVVLTGRRGAHNRLGIALQTCSARYLGTFLPDLRVVPLRVVQFVARQLDIADPLPLLDQYQASQMRFDHMEYLKDTLHYEDFTEPGATFGLVRHLYVRTWTSNERPSVLFEDAVTWLRDHRILLPGITTLTRFIARFRDRVAQRLWQALCDGLTPEQRTRLEAVLTTPPEDKGPRLDTLRRGETRVSSPGLLRALARLESARSVGVAEVDLAQIPVQRLKALAAYAITSKADSIADLTEERRLATLLAFVQSTMKTACDDALDILDGLIETVLRNAIKSRRKERLRTLRDLDAAALTLADSDAEWLAHPTWTAEEIKTYFEAQRAIRAPAVQRVHDLARPEEEVPFQELRGRYETVRRFLPKLLKTIDFEATAAAAPLAHAHGFLKSLIGQKQPSMEAAPLEFVPVSWKKHVQPQGQAIDREMYTLCFMLQLQEAMHTRDMFVPAAERWSDPRVKLLQGDAWTQSRAMVGELLHRSLDAQEELTQWEGELDALYRQLGANVPKGVTITSVSDKETGKMQDHLSLEALEAQEDPPSLRHLRTVIERRMPMTDLSALTREIEARTQLASAFTHIGGSESRLPDFSMSLCAVLLAQACNLPVAAVAEESIPALTTDRLVHIQTNYLRPETITLANARLVEFHQQIPLATMWGGGEVASADGLRFVVPVRTVNAGPNSKYFGTGKGVTLLNYTMNHFFGFNGAVVTGTLRDSLFVLDGLLEQTSSLLQPQEIMTDTASYSDVVFGLFSLLGYRFSPRLADLPDKRLWRFDMAADYGALGNLSKHRLDKRLIFENWEDILRIVGSLRLGRLRASEALRMLKHDNRPTTLGRALAEVGRIGKTAYLLNFIADETYRRRIEIQLNRGESRHALARAIFYGQRGELRQAYREGQEEQLGVLGLMVNMVVIWNTLYQDRILMDVRNRGVDVRREDIERLSPLGRDHIKIQGHYPFTLADEVQRGGFLPLRDWQEDLLQQ